MWCEKTEALAEQRGRLGLAFGELAAEWVEHHAKIKIAPSTCMIYEAQLAVILPLIGRKFVQDLGFADVERLITALKSFGDKSNLTINRDLGVVRTILNY